MHLKNTFIIKSSIFVLVPKDSLEGPLGVLGVRNFRGPLGDVPGTSCAGWIFNLFYIFFFTYSLLTKSLTFFKSIATVFNLTTYKTSTCFKNQFKSIRTTTTLIISSLSVSAVSATKFLLAIKLDLSTLVASSYSFFVG